MSFSRKSRSHWARKRKARAPKSTAKATPYTEGRDNWHAGGTAGENPYRQGSSECEAWAQGYEDARKQEESGQ